jgi:hypothetical protein
MRVITQAPEVVADTLAVDSKGTRRGWGGRGRPLDRQAGQAFVEFALILIVLSVLLVGVTDIAQVFYFDVMTSAAANAGVRAAANGRTDAEVRTEVRNSFGGYWGSASRMPDSNILITPPEVERMASAQPCWTTVNITFAFTPLTPLWSSLTDSPPQITRSASQRVRSAPSTATTPCV